MNMEEIDHPQHYNKNGYECIDVMRGVWGAEVVNHFCLGNAFKYIYRCKAKHETPLADLKKARWYLDYIIKNEEAKERRIMFKKGE